MDAHPYYPPGEQKRLVVGISGATGIVYGIRLLEELRDTDVETHLVVSRPGLMTLNYETDMTREALYALADHVYSPRDVGAAISSCAFSCSPAVQMLHQRGAAVSRGHTDALHMALVLRRDVVVKQ